jgi:hypothetical protein
VVEVNEGVGRPEAGAHLVARDKLTWATEKHGQDFESLSDELDPGAEFPQLAGM